MTMIAEHGATVLPFTDALLRAPKDRSATLADTEHTAPDSELPDNVIVLARFSRRARKAHRRFWLGGPPEGEAA
jgi:hypothetical protein